METKKAIEILEHHQQWRLGNVQEMKYTPREITEALDVLLEEFKKKEGFKK